MRLKYLIIAFLLCLSFFANGQVADLLEPQRVDVLPEYIEGISEWSKYVKKNLKYPKFAKKNGIQGIVYVNASISIDGKVLKTSIFKGLYESCDSAALDFMKKSPWSPGKIKNNEGDLIPVQTSVVIPIIFK
jgi:protein TonB